MRRKACADLEDRYVYQSPAVTTRRSDLQADRHSCAPRKNGAPSIDFNRAVNFQVAGCANVLPLIGNVITSNFSHRTNRLSISSSTLMSRGNLHFLVALGNLEIPRVG